MSHCTRPRLRRGFTLVEMLVVIMIMAMLMGMTSFAVWKVILNAKVAKVAVEIEQLAQAMNSYKQSRIQYPPCLGALSLTARKTTFLRHISLAYTNANYGSSPLNFDEVRNKVISWGYNYRNAAGSIANLDLHNLDQAESLVFWLGGFPTPITSTSAVANRRLFGFHRDEDNPFKRDTAFEAGAPLQYRTDPQFNFDETRLIDIDGDGWLEYAALIQRPGESNAPYVYFDSGTYGLSTNTTSTGWLHYCYPRPDNNNAASTTAQQVAERFGVASPLALSIDVNRVQPTRWANNTGIQIICAGLDGKYSDSVPGGTALTTVQKAQTFPRGEVYFGANYASVRGLSREDMDNQTNLSDKTVDSARTEAAQ